MQHASIIDDCNCHVCSSYHITCSDLLFFFVPNTGNIKVMFIEKC